MKAAITATIAVSIEDKDTYFVAYKSAKKTSIAIKKISGWSNRSTHADVATALPPRKPAKIG